MLMCSLVFGTCYLMTAILINFTESKGRPFRPAFFYADFLTDIYLTAGIFTSIMEPAGILTENVFPVTTSMPSPGREAIAGSSTPFIFMCMRCMSGSSLPYHVLPEGSKVQLLPLIPAVKPAIARSACALFFQSLFTRNTVRLPSASFDAQALILLPAFSLITQFSGYFPGTAFGVYSG